MESFASSAGSTTATSSLSPIRRFYRYSPNMTPEEVAQSEEELQFLKRTVANHSYTAILMLDCMKELRSLGVTNSELRYNLQNYELELSEFLQKESARLEREGDFCYRNLTRFREMASAVIILRYAHHYSRESTIAKTALDLVSRLQYEQVHRPPWNSFMKTLRKETEDVRAWWHKIHSPEYKKQYWWRGYGGEGEKRISMPLTDEMGEMCNIHWTAAEEFLTDYLNCPYEFETIDDLLFVGNWSEGSHRIIADLWAMSNSIFPASLIHLRKEIEQAITQARNTYFKVVRSALSHEWKPYHRMFKEEFGPYRERLRAYSYEKVDQIQTHGLRWNWDERAGTDFDCFKWSLDYALRIGHGFDLSNDEVVKKEDTWWGTRYFTVDRKDGRLLRTHSVRIFGNFEIYAGPGVKGKIEKIEMPKRR